MVLQTKNPLGLRDNEVSTCDGCPKRGVTGDNDGLGSSSEGAFDTGLLIVLWPNGLLNCMYVSYSTGVFEVFIIESGLSEYSV